MSKKIIVIIIDIILLCITSLLSFTYAPPSSVFVFAYIFLIFSIFSQIVPAFLADRAKELANRILLYTISACYLILQIIISFLGFSVLNNNKITVVVISTILFLIYMASILITYNVFKKEEYLKDNENNKVFFIDNVVYKLKVYRQHIKNEEILALLDDIIETARYGNLNSNSEAYEIEANILSALDNLEKVISDSKLIESKHECKKIISMLQERNMICKLYK